MAARCPHCLGCYLVCEAHPAFPWEGDVGSVEGHAAHGAAGMPCPRCCGTGPYPRDGYRQDDALPLAVALLLAG